MYLQSFDNKIDSSCLDKQVKLSKIKLTVNWKVFYILLSLAKIYLDTVCSSRAQNNKGVGGGLENEDAKEEVV